MISVSANDSRDRTNLSLFKLIKINDRQLFEAILPTIGRVLVYSLGLERNWNPHPKTMSCGWSSNGRVSFCNAAAADNCEKRASPSVVNPKIRQVVNRFKLDWITAKRQFRLVGSKLPTARYRWACARDVSRGWRWGHHLVNCQKKTNTMLLYVYV